MAEQSPSSWHELVTPDQRASGQFFRELLNWTSREVDAGGTLRFRPIHPCQPRCPAPAPQENPCPSRQAPMLSRSGASGRPGDVHSAGRTTR